MDTLLFYVVPVCALVALLLIYYLPKRLIPETRSSRQEDLIKTIESRNEVRKTYAQMFAGASFVVTFMLSIYNFNRDFSQKAKQSAADQFLKTSGFVQATDEAQWTHVNAFEIMALTAREDSSFNAAVFGTMAQFLLKVSKFSCKKYDDTNVGYQMPPELQRIAQIFAGNNVPDPWNKKMNLAGACLSRAQLRDSNGLQQLYLKDAQLIGTEFANSNLRGSDIQDVKGGIDLTDWWKKDEAVQEQVEKDGYDAVYRLFDKIHAWHWANFSSATLDDVVANRAHLQGAIFYSASMMRSTWEDADLSFADLAGANLRSAHLIRTNFKGASLRSTSLEDADLTDVKLERTNMLDAFFANTNVSRVDFRTTQLKRAQLSGMCISAEKDKPTLPETYSDFNVPVCYENFISRSLAWSRAALAQALWTE